MRLLLFLLLLLLLLLLIIIIIIIITASHLTSQPLARSLRCATKPIYLIYDSGRWHLAASGPSKYSP